jgi:hypothetical protein
MAPVQGVVRALAQRLGGMEAADMLGFSEKRASPNRHPTGRPTSCVWCRTRRRRSRTPQPQCWEATPRRSKIANSIIRSDDAAAAADV